MLDSRHVGLGAAAVLAIAAAAHAPLLAGPDDAAAPAPPAFGDIIAAAAPGDVLFKSGAGGLWGALAGAFSEDDGRFGHVGVVARSGTGALTVIHASGDPVSREGRARADPIDRFLTGVTAAALYRPAPGAVELEPMLAYAASAAARAAPFDRQFSLASDDSLYCTELVWRALSAASAEDPVPEKSARGGRVYISLEDLQSSPLLRLAAESPASAPLPNRPAP